MSTGGPADSDTWEYVLFLQRRPRRRNGMLAGVARPRQRFVVHCDEFGSKTTAVQAIRKLYRSYLQRQRQHGALELLEEHDGSAASHAQPLAEIEPPSDSE